MKWSRLALGTNSYIKSFSFPSKQKPRSLTKFRCWSLATNKTSFLNSRSPCLESLDNLFTAISCPFESLPWRYIRTSQQPTQYIEKFDNYDILYLVLFSKYVFIFFIIMLLLINKHLLWLYMYIELSILPFNLKKKNVMWQDYNGMCKKGSLIGNPFKKIKLSLKIYVLIA